MAAQQNRSPIHRHSDAARRFPQPADRDSTDAYVSYKLFGADGRTGASLRGLPAAIPGDANVTSPLRHNVAQQGPPPGFPAGALPQPPPPEALRWIYPRHSDAISGRVAPPGNAAALGFVPQFAPPTTTPVWPSAATWRGPAAVPGSGEPVTVAYPFPPSAAQPTYYVLASQYAQYAQQYAHYAALPLAREAHPLPLTPLPEAGVVAPAAYCEPWFADSGFGPAARAPTPPELSSPVAPRSADPRAHVLATVRGQTLSVPLPRKSTLVPEDKLTGTLGESAALRSRGLFKSDDWKCAVCLNINWARRSHCNLCHTPRPAGSGRGPAPSRRPDSPPGRADYSWSPDARSRSRSGSPERSRSRSRSPERSRSRSPSPVKPLPVRPSPSVAPESIPRAPPSSPRVDSSSRRAINEMLAQLAATRATVAPSSPRRSSANIPAPRPPASAQAQELSSAQRLEAFLRERLSSAQADTSGSEGALAKALSRAQGG